MLVSFAFISSALIFFCNYGSPFPKKKASLYLGSEGYLPRKFLHSNSITLMIWAVSSVS
jgi:hypothetical protein